MLRAHPVCAPCARQEGCATPAPPLTRGQGRRPRFCPSATSPRDALRNQCGMERFSFCFAGPARRAGRDAPRPLGLRGLWGTNPLQATVPAPPPPRLCARAPRVHVPMCVCACACAISSHVCGVLWCELHASGLSPDTPNITPTSSPSAQARGAHFAATDAPAGTACAPARHPRERV